MKTNLLIPSLVLFFAAASLVVAQTDTSRIVISKIQHPQKNSDNTSWEVALNFGMTHAITDLAAEKWNLSFGVSATHFFTHNFAGQFQILHTTLAGSDKHGRFDFETTINYDLSFNAVILIRNVGFLKRTPNFGLYAYAGAGLINFDCEFNSTNGLEKLSDTEFLIPFGAGMRYHFAKRLSVHGEYSLRTTRTDKLDGWVRQLSAYDDYNYFNAGITYCFFR
jgi:opacity protein-like surface antigen